MTTRRRSPSHMPVIARSMPLITCKWVRNSLRFAAEVAADHLARFVGQLVELFQLVALLGLDRAFGVCNSHINGISGAYRAFKMLSKLNVLFSDSAQRSVVVREMNSTEESKEYHQQV
ncbi:hypothetical protein PRIPAC_72204 [Pristionchus pacificus]|uniref:Uncharacterized protein n=1 Tax=Pristionchus pacificus TaxID=54126 RepID=A0A2A6C737_PRIPA|nr:hypothetical protein PRIPAC_72204 [Pristionchus pacificus]|eukprot:PDM73878.1 hypothetical protein PRIPAC_41234 [Pristionchus pacificus]